MYVDYVSPQYITLLTPGHYFFLSSLLEKKNVLSYHIAAHCPVLSTATEH